MMLKAYLRRRGITLIGLSSIAMFIVSVGGFVFAYIVEPIGRVLEYEPMMTYLFLGTFQIDNPVVYVLVLSCWRGVLAGLYTFFSIMITLSTKNIFVAMTSAFVYSIMENFILAVLQVPELSICTSFYPNRLTGSAISYGKLAVGPIILLVITLLTYFYNKWKYKR